MKRIAAIILVFVLLLPVSGGVLAAEYDGTVTPASVLLFDPDSGETLYEKAADTRVYPASTTKILTALVVLEKASDLQTVVTVDAAAVEGIIEGDDSTLTPMLQAGEQLTVEQLLYGLMLVSGNDCASALAYYIAGGSDAFASLMNKKAESLGMSDSHFRNPHGVQNEEHYTTARDMGKLAKAALNTPAFMKIVSTAEYRLPATNRSEERVLQTSNRFLLEKDDLPGTACTWVTGMKTGYTPTAGGCLVTSAEYNGRRLLCLVYNDSSEEQRDRWFLTKSLLEYGFDTSYSAAGALETEPAAQMVPTEDEIQAENPAPAPSRGKQILFTALGIVLLLLVLAILILAVNQLNRAKRHYRRRLTAAQRRRAVMPSMVLAGVLLLPALFCFLKAGSVQREIRAFQETEAARAADIAQKVAMEAAKPVFAPAAAQSADPALWGIEWTALENGQPASDYQRTPGISFGEGADYFALPGVATFRGNNYRDGGSFGTAEIRDNALETKWTVSTGSLAGEKGTWTGSGWTGQPLIAQWDAATRSAMNLYDGKKAKEGLVEVIYATLDGHVYFMDLDDGSATRDPVDLGMPFKGAGALDPRGYPLLYVGSGDATSDGRRPRMFIVSLIDGSVLYQYGDEDPFSLRQDNDRWCAFDSSPLVDAETDTLIWPGESGVLYTIHLNTSYDPAAGTVSVAPEEPVRARYDTTRSSEDQYWYGMESSAVIVDRCLYVSENGGMFFCVDLDTMELLWAQDTRDDSNSTPVYEPDGDDHGYLYTAPSLHWTANEDRSGNVSIYKLDAITGEVVWSRSYDCWTVDGVSGGVQSSPVLGRKGSSIDGLVIYGISRTPWEESGVLAALDTRTGNEVWSLNMDHYAWSSPLALYDSAGTARLVLCDSNGTAFLIDGATGQIVASTYLGALVEASPAAFNDTIVVGTRGQQICALRAH